MFTGIIQEIGTVVRVERSRGLVRLSVQAPHIASKVGRLESVAVNGACLSVVTVRHGVLTFDMIAETQHRTTLGHLRRGGRVNLEPSLGICDRLNGHFVFGHVDGVGTVVTRRQLAGELIFGVRLSAGLRKFLVPKGSVAVDGVSLTVGKMPTASTFTLHLIPETLRQTTLGEQVVGDRVNIELDYLAKLVWHAIRR